MEDKTKVIPTEQKNIPRIYNNAIEKMLDEMPKDFSEMQKARYLYINLGKLLAYDERYTVGNGSAQRKIFRMAKENVITFNKIKEGKKFKGICIDLNRLYANVLRNAGIQSFINYGYGPVPHDSVTAQLEGHYYCLDMQRDLIHIQLNQMTDFFGFQDDGEDMCDRLLSTEEVIKLDESIGFKNYSYEGGRYVRSLREKFESICMYTRENEEKFQEYMRFKSLPIKDRVEEMLREISTIPGIKELGYTERTRVYCQMVKHGLAYGEYDKFRIDNLYSIDSETKLPREVVEVFTVVHTENQIQRFARYIYDHVKKEYVEISNMDLIKKIEAEGLRSKKELAGMRKIKREMKKETAAERRIFAKLEKNPMKETDGCAQVFNIDDRFVDEVEPEIVVDLSVEEQEKAKNEPKKASNSRKSTDPDGRDI